MRCLEPRYDFENLCSLTKRGSKCTMMIGGRLLPTQSLAIGAVRSSGCVLTAKGMQHERLMSSRRPKSRTAYAYADVRAQAFEPKCGKQRLRCY